MATKTANIKVEATDQSSPHLKAVEDRLNAIEKAGKGAHAALHAVAGEMAGELSKVPGGGAIGAGLGAGWGGAGLAAAAGIGGAVGAVGMVQQMVKDLNEESVAILRNAEAAGVSTDTWQLWTHIAKEAGLEADKLPGFFRKFNTELYAGAPGLQHYGLQLKQLGIDTRDPERALEELADYFHRTGDAGQKASIAQALFGRGSQQIIPVLNLGSSALRAYMKELEDMGVILGKDQLEIGAVGKAVESKLGLALEGIKNQVLMPLQIVFTFFWQALIQGAETTGGFFKKFGEVVASVGAWVLGFLNQIFNLGITADGLKKSLNDAGTALQGIGASGDEAAASSNKGADSMARLREQTRHATDAITDQVDVIRKEVSAREEQVRMDDLLQQREDDLHRSALAQLQDRLAAITNVNDSRRHQGEDLITYQRRREADELQGQIKDETAKRALAKNTTDLALERFKTEKNARIAELDEQRQALQRTLQDEEAANSRASEAMSLATSGSVGKQKADFKGLGDVVTTMFNTIPGQAMTSGGLAAKAIQDAFSDKDGALAGTSKLLGKALASGLAQGFDEALTGGTLGGAGRILDQIFAGIGQNLREQYGDNSELTPEMIAAIQDRQRGTSAELPANLPARQNHGQRESYITQHFHGPVATMATAKIVAQQTAAEVGRAALQARGSFF